MGSDNAGLGAVSATPDGSKMRLLVDKKQLLADTVRLQGLLHDYCAFLAGISPEADWAPKAQHLLRDHVQFLEHAGVSLQSLDLCAALIRHVMSLHPGDQVALPTRAATASGQPDSQLGPEGRGLEEVRQLIAQVNTLSTHAPIAMQERLRFLLKCLLQFLEMLPHPNPAKLEQVMSEINLLTSSRESRHLVREVARLARDAYNSVKSMSDGLPLETLEETTDGASEAVRKLRSVIQRLERAAIDNLDLLERINGAQTEDTRQLAQLAESARRIQQSLAKLKAAQPEAGERVERILERMGNEVAATIIQLASAYPQQGDQIIQQVSNQSFQDLSGAALKKIIAFVESTQLQLVAVLERYRSVLNLVQSDLALRPGERATPARAATESSQDQVDALLAKLGV